MLICERRIAHEPASQPASQPVSVFWIMIDGVVAKDVNVGLDVRIREAD